jgi:SAM-dependent methyltransferase
MTPDQIVDFEFFLRSIKSNRFIPVPEADRIFTGGGAPEFLQHGIDTFRSLVRFADVAPSSRVLEIGSGLGRVALPLTQWLSGGSYVGVEIVMQAVAWSHENIARRYENFRFLHLDIYNEFYNPAGRGTVAEAELPFDPASFDVVFLNSVFTHLDRDDVRAYLAEIARVLAPGGRLWGSWFLVDEGIGGAVLDGRAQIPLGWGDGHGAYYTNDRNGTAAVAYDERRVLDMLASAGFEVRIASKGEWLTGRPRIDGGFQDLLVCGLR